MAVPKVQIASIANVYTRMMHFAAEGDRELGHAHPFDHCTLLSAGRLRVTVDGRVREFTAPHLIFIRAGSYHELEALEPDTVACCIHGLRNADGDILSPASMP